MALTKPWFSHYDEVKVPKGYFLCHYETGHRNDRPAYRTVVIRCGKTHEVVAELEEYYDPCAGKARYGATRRNSEGDAVQRFDDYSLEKLFLLVCARHRMGIQSTTKG